MCAVIIDIGSVLKISIAEPVGVGAVRTGAVLHKGVRIMICIKQIGESFRVAHEVNTGFRDLHTVAEGGHTLRTDSGTNIRHRAVPDILRLWGRGGFHDRSSAASQQQDAEGKRKQFFHGHSSQGSRYASSSIIPSGSSNSWIWMLSVPKSAFSI